MSFECSQKWKVKKELTFCNCTGGKASLVRVFELVLLIATLNHQVADLEVPELKGFDICEVLKGK